MSKQFFYRRRAERFAQLLDEANGGRRHHVRYRHDGELTELVALGQRIPIAEPSAEVDPGFRSDLRAMLIATAQREGIGTASTANPLAETGPRRGTRRAARGPAKTALRGQQTRARARGAIILGVAAGAIAVSGMSAASESALPGDALYGMKRSTERAQLALTSSDLSRGQLFLGFARTRLAEAEAVKGDDFGFAAVLDDMDNDTRQGVKLLATSSIQRKDGMALEAISTFLSTQQHQVAALFDGATFTERTRAGKSLALLDRIQVRTDGLRAGLLCGADSLTVNADDLGPLPRQCAGDRPSVGGNPRPVPTGGPTDIRSPELPRAERTGPAEQGPTSPQGGAELGTRPQDLTGEKAGEPAN